MKRVVLIVVSIFILITYNNVYAKDTVRSINKYNDESLNYILKGYNEKQEESGFVSAGTFLKETFEEEDNEYDDIQIMIVKYDKQGKLLWKYDYGKTKGDYLHYLTYSYNNENKIDGYIIYVDNTYDKEEQVEQKITTVKVDLKGKLIEEKELNLQNASINKVIYSYNNENIIDGYIIIGQKDNKGYISKYDINLNEIWTKSYEEDNSNIKDIVLLRENNIPKEYITITTTVSNKVIRFDLDGNNPSLIREDFEEKDKPRLLDVNNSYIIYGYTNEVKLDNNKSSSFYINKYTSGYEEEWETIGNVPIDTNKLLELYPVYEKEELKEYMMMSTNSKDSSIEVTRINKDGTIENKVKKIKNDYYDINSFIFDNDSLYFIGQINCPEDDNCDYDSNSLFLISDEDKVIEVKEDDNKTILIVIGSIIVLSVVAYIYYRKKNQT